MSREAMTLTIKNSLLGMRLFFSLDYFGWFIHVAQEKKGVFVFFILINQPIVQQPAAEQNAELKQTAA